MWIFTRYGFFSAVCARRDGSPDAIDPTRVMVRARDREHLVRLKAAFGVKAAIVVTPDRDYPWRIVLPKAAWTTILSALSDEMDYGNFKAEAERRFGEQHSYPTLLHRLWGMVYGHYADLRPKAGAAKAKRQAAPCPENPSD